MICGIFTGYKFSSFRIGNWIWLKEQERIAFKKLSVTGTAGQCLMAPPDMPDGNYPFVLYNLGGSFLNAVTGLVFLGLAALSKNLLPLSSLFFLAGVVRSGFALMNGIPLRFGTTNNDGYNALSLGKSREAAHSFWMQLNMNAQIAKGMRVKDMPDEWFYIPTGEGMKNSMTAVMGVLYCTRLMDAHLFEEAYSLMNELLETDSAIIGLHRSLLNCDRIYCELIGENNKERLEIMLDKEQQRFMKAMRKFPSVLRTEYAYALIAGKEPGKAEKIKDTFEKCARTYPYPSDVEGERELIKIAEAFSS